MATTPPTPATTPRHSRGLVCRVCDTPIYATGPDVHCQECGSAIPQFRSSDLLNAKTPNGEGLHNDDLAGSAAKRAAETLAGNWAQALSDGDRIESLADDVDDVVATLLAWKAAVLHKVGAGPAAPGGPA